MKLFFPSRDKARTFKQAYKGSFKAQIKDNGKAGEPMATEALECDVKPLWWQEQGLQYTASGYGSKIPTQYVVKHNNRWKRVYCRIYSNAGTLYILQGKERIIVSHIEE